MSEIRDIRIDQDCAQGCWYSEAVGLIFTDTIKESLTNEMGVVRIVYTVPHDQVIGCIPVVYPAVAYRVFEEDCTEV